MKPLETVQTLAREVSGKPFGETNSADLAVTEARAYLAKTNLSAAEKIINRAVQKQPNDEGLRSGVVNHTLISGHFSKALPHVDEAPPERHKQLR